jgi:cysteine desulfurase/selenocysteine lyase
VQQGKCQLRFDGNTPTENLTDLLCQAITTQTKAVAVSCVQFATGCKVDPVALRQATDAVGACLLLDVTQAAGAIPLSFDTWKPDVMVTSSGYKWLGGHGGVALAALSPELAKETTPLLPGWMGVSDPFDLPARTSRELHVADTAHRYTQSTMSYASVAALTASIEELLALGIDRVEGHSSTLANQLLRELATSMSNWEPFRPLEDPCASHHIVSLSNHHDGHVDVAALVERLRQANIVCGSRGGRLRVSISGFNGCEDIGRLVETLLLMKH